MNPTDWQEIAIACGLTLVVVGVIAAKLATELARVMREVEHLKNKEKRQ